METAGSLSRNYMEEKHNVNTETSENIHTDTHCLSSLFSSSGLASQLLNSTAALLDFSVLKFFSYQTD